MHTIAEYVSWMKKAQELDPQCEHLVLYQARNHYLGEAILEKKGWVQPYLERGILTPGWVWKDELYPNERVKEYLPSASKLTGFPERLAQAPPELELELYHRGPRRILTLDNCLLAVKASGAEIMLLLTPECGSDGAEPQKLFPHWPHALRRYDVDNSLKIYEYHDSSPFFHLPKGEVQSIADLRDVAEEPFHDVLHFCHAPVHSYEEQKKAQQALRKAGMIVLENVLQEKVPAILTPRFGEPVLVNRPSAT